MLKLRKSDIGKAIVLVVAIVAVGAFGIYNVSRSLRPARPAPRRAQVAPQPGVAATPAGMQMSTSGQMYAPQQQGATANLLAQARYAPDPFRPAVSFQTRPAAARAEPASPPKQKEPTRAQPLPALPGEKAESTTLETLGIVSGDAPLAVLGDGTRRYYVRAGDMVVDGWRVAAIHSTSVTVSKGKTQVTLPLVAPPP